MAVVTWNRGPWATKPSAPYQSLTTAPQGEGRPIDASARPNDAYASLLTPGGVGDNSGMSSKGEPSAFGDAPSISGALGGGWAGRIGGTLASRAADLGLSLATQLSPSPIGGPMAAYGLISNIGRAVRSLMGAPSYESNPLAGAPTTSDVQNAMDMGGVTAGRAAQAARDSAIAQAGGLTPEFGGITPADLAGNPAGWGSNTLGAPTPGVADPDSPFGAGPRGFGMGIFGSEYGTNMGNSPSVGGDYGGTSGNDAGDRGSNDPGSDHDTGGAGHGGPGGATMARGGSKRFTRPTQLRVGDNPAQDETIIGVPREMRRPGMQGNERQVRRGLRSAYHSLMPRGPMAPGGR